MSVVCDAMAKICMRVSSIHGTCMHIFDHNLLEDETQTGGVRE